MKESKPLKTWHLIAFIAIVVVAIIYSLYQRMWPKTVVKIGGRTISVLVANTDQHRYDGWSGRKDMGKYQGMLFVFGDSGQHAMVMRNMEFPLDIVWVYKNKIAEIAPNVRPEPGKTEAELTTYFTNHPSNYVLELPAGFMDRTGIKIGDEVVISGY